MVYGHGITLSSENLASVKFWHEHYHCQNEPTCQQQDMTKGMLLWSHGGGYCQSCHLQGFWGPCLRLVPLTPSLRGNGDEVRRLPFLESAERSLSMPLCSFAMHRSSSSGFTSPASSTWLCILPSGNGRLRFPKGWTNQWLMGSAIVRPHALGKMCFP